jgi:predicted phage terminase large subunit-like protein
LSFIERLLLAARRNPQAALLAADAEAARRKFREFARLAWPILVPGTPLVEHFAFDAICEHLEAVSRGQIKKLIINVPPGMAKSTLVAVLWPCWEWTWRPTVQWLFATYAKDLTFRDASKRRDFMSDQWYTDRFGEAFELSKEGVQELRNSRMGHMFSTSTGGQTTGWRGDRLVLDDPQDPKGAESDIKRASTIEWLTRTWPTRINAGSSFAAEILIQQRLHEQDATGLYLKAGGWDHLKIPLEYTGKKYSTSIGATDPREGANQSISERLYPPAHVVSLKKALGPYGVAGQLQQEPAPAEGGIIKRAWIERFYTREGEYLEIPDYKFRPRDHFVFVTLDPAVTKDEIEDQTDPDYTCMGVWCCMQTTGGPVLCLLDRTRERLEGPDIIPKLEEVCKVWHPALVAIETVAFQKSIFQQAKRKGIPCREMSTKEDALIRIDGDKVARAYAATPLMADGRFFVPPYAPWLPEYIQELTSFPNAAHDDQVDMTTYACAIALKVEQYAGRTYDGGGEETRVSQERDDDAPPDPLAGWKPQVDGMAGYKPLT